MPQIDLGELKLLIQQSVFVKNSEQQIDIHTDPDAWIFDFRRILLRGHSADIIANIFYEQFKHEYPFQLCSIEIAGVPLLTSLINKFYSHGHHDVNGFFVRKSRKKTGLMRMIEGTIEDTKKIILVDDIMNRGDSFWRQIEVIESLGYTVHSVWSILRYRDLPYYQRFHDRGITVRSLFTLDEFTKHLGPRVKNLVEKNDLPPAMPFTAQWIFKSPRPSLNYVVSKSQPILDQTKIYFGSDNQIFWAINQNDGSVAWKFNVGAHVKRKSIFSSPAFFQNLVIFGSYDGNIYALDRSTGKKVWVNFEADWVGSSPAVSERLGLVFTGLEFGLFRKRGGIVAIHARTGETVWKDTHTAYTHSSPLYIDGHAQVIIGSNDGVARLYDAENGTLLWSYSTVGATSFNETNDTGFGDGDIKESFAYDSDRDYIIFGSIDGFLYILKRETGTLVYRYQTEFGIWSTPYIYKGYVYFTSLDKRLRCINLDDGKLHFEIDVDNTRLFGSPIVINEKLYVGTNGGRLHELNPSSGAQLGYYQTLERITNQLLYNQSTDTYFLPTYANEIISLKRLSTNNNS